MKIQELKEVKIVEYLQSLGIEPVKSVGRELVYLSPKTNEKNPSFFVNPAKNVFTDYSGNDKGDVIRLVQHLQDCDFTTACKQLESFSFGYTPQKQVKPVPFSFNGNNDNKLNINEIKELQANSLMDYCETRKIPFHIAFKYLSEVHYSNNGKSYYSLGFKNDKGGFELRNQHFKGCTAPKDVTTFEVRDSKEIYLFEGFFDFLSALSFFGTSKARCTVIVLNSLSLLSKVKERINKAQKIHCFLDRDTQGFKSIEKLTNNNLPILDRSKIYEGYKDFNEFISSTK